MTKLADAVLSAIEKYDQVLVDNTTGSGEDQADNAEVAAHECVAEVRAALEAEPTENLNNPIAKLQERAQARQEPLPEYSFTQAGEPHTPRITCVCTSEGIKGTGKGPNKQTAKRRAALVVLEGMHGIRKNGDS